MTDNNSAGSPFLGGRWLVALGLVAAVFAMAALGSLRYSGLVGQMGEWQFGRIGFYMPMLSVLAWVGLATAVIALVGRLLSRRDETADGVLAQVRHDGTLLRNALLAIGFLSGLVAFAGAINLFALPSGGGAERLVTPATLSPGVEGNTRLQGFRVAGPMARYSEGVLFWKQDLFLVPLAGSAQGDQEGVRVFAQVTQYEAGTKVPGIHRGILRQGALPRELYPLFAAQGVAVQDNAAVLYRNSSAMALSTLLIIGEAATVALIAFVVALIIHRRRPRVIGG